MHLCEIYEQKLEILIFFLCAVHRAVFFDSSKLLKRKRRQPFQINMNFSLFSLLFRLCFCCNLAISLEFALCCSGFSISSFHYLCFSMLWLFPWQDANKKNCSFNLQISFKLKSEKQIIKILFRIF